MSTYWTAEHVRAIDANGPAAPLVGEAEVVPVGPTIEIWDAWPVQLRDGRPLKLDSEAELWMALGAPHFTDLDERHGHARICAIVRRGGKWHLAGPVMPDGFSPGSREWSGSAIFDDASGEVILYFTAAGRRGERETSFEQRMFSARARLDRSDGALSGWHSLCEVIPAAPDFYMSTTGGGGIGTIKAFRDPAYFRDPGDGSHYLFFAGSLAGSASAYNGVIGMACAPAAAPDDWAVRPPLILADGLNNELERPHVVHYDDRYYVFWSTQRHVFAPDGPTGPTGLYAMVAETLGGPWRPVNGSGLVFANPEQAPAQCYSWLVLPDLRVTSFIDNWGDGSVRRFGGTFAPFVRIWLKGDRAGISGA